jgi:hypothetical protein
MAERDDLPTDELLQLVLDRARADLHTALPATVTRYDATKKRADVRVGVRRALPDPDGETVYEDLPVLPNVPVGWLGAGDFFLHLPLAVGDTGWLMFAETDTSRWRATGEVSNPRDLSRHGLSSPTFFPTPRVPPTDDGAYMACPDAFSFGSPAAAKLLALAEKVDQELNDLKSVFSGWSPVPNDGGAALKVAVTTWAGTPADTACTKLKAE